MIGKKKARCVQRHLDKASRDLLCAKYILAEDTPAYRAVIDAMKTICVAEDELKKMRTEPTNPDADKKCSAAGIMECADNRKIVVNGLITPDGTFIVSRHQHDMASYVDSVTGERYFIDGGNNITYRRSANEVEATHILLFEDSPFEELRKYVERGTTNKEGARIWVPIARLSDAHLPEIVKYNKKVNGSEDDWFTKLIISEMKYRKEHGITIPEYEYDNVTTFEKKEETTC
jgi:hypothetical protein